MEIEFADLTVKLQTKIYFEEGASNIKMERTILEMSDPTAEVELNEYMVACYGTTEYPEDMTGITLACEGSETKTISYEYKCREESLAGAKAVSAVIPAIQTKVSLTPSADAEGYIKKKVSDKEVFATWLNLEKAN